jgi:signal recognition particle subunit SRP54
MTPEERADPDLINPSRKKRIAKGAGKDINEVNAFMKQFEQMRGMMKGMNKAGMFGGKAMPGLRK